MDRDPLTGIPPSRHPFQMWMFLASVFSGAQALIRNDAAPATLEGLIPTWTVLVWAALLVVAGAVGVPAGFWKDRITGLLMERIALAALCAAVVVYGLVLIDVAGKPGTVSACFQMSVGIAAVWRIRHVNRELKILKTWLQHRAQDKARKLPWRDPTEDL